MVKKERREEEWRSCLGAGKNVKDVEIEIICIKIKSLADRCIDLWEFFEKWQKFIENPLHENKNAEQCQYDRC